MPAKVRRIILPLASQLLITGLFLTAILATSGTASARTFLVGKSFQIGNDSEAVFIANGDFNHDGRLDLAVSDFNGTGYVDVLFGIGGGQFKPPQRYPVNGMPLQAVIADMNGDGNPDIVVITGLDHVSILLGTASGFFQPAVSYATGPSRCSPTELAVADVNGDGKLDVVVTNSNSNTLGVLLGNGDGTLAAAHQYPTGLLPLGLVIHDFNGDNKPDVGITNYQNGNVSILLGNGDGSFQSPVAYSTTSPLAQWMVIGDFNGDDIVDLAVQNRDGLVLLMGNGNGTFQAARRVVNAVYPHGLTFLLAMDLNHDGKMDIVASSIESARFSVFLGNGNGTFQPGLNFGAETTPGPFTVGDFNGDGKTDLITIALFGPLTVVLGNGDGTFEAPRMFDTGNQTVAVALADFNRDSKLDVV